MSDESTPTVPPNNELSDSVSAEEQESLNKLRALDPPGSGPVIAIDLDDVLSQTNHAIANWHNKEYETAMTLKDFYYYYYWKNPFWGDLKETFTKVSSFYHGNDIYEATPVPGAREGTQTLKDMGYRLIIVTARMRDTRDKSWDWVNQHFPNIFDSIICTGQFEEANKTGKIHEIKTKLTKAEVCESIGARVLIDDSSENALELTELSSVPVILFGDYEWNSRVCMKGDTRAEMVYATRLAAEGEFWKTDKFHIPNGAPITRAKDWSEVIRLIKAWRSENAF